MSKKPLILLVEDDKQLASSLESFLNQSNFDCLVANSPKQAKEMIKLHTFKAAVVDCLLPQMNGIDLAQLLQEDNPLIHIIFMSGVYKDKHFSTNALKKTGAKSFLIKPFKPSQLIDILKEHISTTQSVAELPLIAAPLFSNSMSHPETTKWLESLSVVDGFHLPIVFNHIIDAGLNIQLALSTPKYVVTMSFKEQEVHASTSNKSFLKKVRQYLVDNQQVAVSKDSNISALLPQNLIDENLVSPHFVGEASKKFLCRDIDKLIPMKDIGIKIGAPPQEDTPKPEAISHGELHDMIYKWCAEAIPLDDIKSFFEIMQEAPLVPGDKEKSTYRSFPLSNKHMGAIKGINELESLAENGFFAEPKKEEALRVFYLLSSNREYFFEQNASKASENEHQKKKLSALVTNLKHQDYFERLGADEGTSSEDIKQLFNQLSLNLHPDKVKDEDKEIQNLTAEAFQLVQEAYNALKTPEKKKEYLDYLNNREQTLLKEMDKSAMDAMNLLMQGHVQSATNLLNEIDERFDNDKNRLLRAWAHVKSAKVDQQKVATYIRNVSPATKDTALYFHVKALVFISQGDWSKAVALLKGALKKQPDFICSRRELLIAEKQLSEANKQGNKSILSADLKDVVGLFFKKK